MKKLLMVFVLVTSFFCDDAFAQKTIFFDGFETGAFNSTFWKPIPGPNNGIGEVILDNTTPDGFFSVRMGKSSDAGGSNTSELQLHLDLSGRDQVALTFFVKTFFDESGPFDAIYLSDNGGASFPARAAYQFRTSDWVQNAWGMLPPIDIDGLARDLGLKLNKTFVISFRQFGTGDFNTGGDEDGLFLDAVHVYDPNVTYHPIPFSDGFERGRLDSMWTWADPSYPLPGTAPQSTIRPDGLVSVARDGSAPEGFFATHLGRRNDGGPTTNAIDLHLDLSGEDQVDLQFWLRDFFDFDDPEDAIYFSDDGGKIFKKAFQFVPNSWFDNLWGMLPAIDVDRLAHDLNLSLTGSFVIRFQQLGTGDFNGRRRRRSYFRCHQGCEAEHGLY